MLKNINIQTGCWCLVLLTAITGCNHSVPGSAIQQKHLVEINKDGSLLYVDKTSNSRVMEETGETHFISYVIGFTDSVKGDLKYENDKTVYFNYRMSGDWKAVLNGDSLSPVFFQPVTKLNAVSKEGIIVFELPGDKQPDTLVFNDSFGHWERQIIVFNQQP